MPFVVATPEATKLIAAKAAGVRIQNRLKRYVIYGAAETTDHPDLAPAFWSNKEGWCDLSEADVYTEQTRAFVDLPVGGQWLLLPI